MRRPRAVGAALINWSAHYRTENRREGEEIFDAFADREFRRVEREKLETDGRGLTISSIIREIRNEKGEE